MLFQFLMGMLFGVSPHYFLPFSVQNVDFCHGTIRGSDLPKS
nr:MAG TPA: hypothetical protein [Caudoviricetes sp.]